MPFLVTPDGKFLVTADGKFMVGTDCSCCGEANPCTLCSPNLNSALNVAIDDIDSSAIPGFGNTFPPAHPWDGTPYDLADFNTGHVLARTAETVGTCYWWKRWAGQDSDHTDADLEVAITITIVQASITTYIGPPFGNGNQLSLLLAFHFGADFNAGLGETNRPTSGAAAGEVNRIGICHALETDVATNGLPNCADIFPLTLFGSDINYHNAGPSFNGNHYPAIAQGTFIISV